jgi:UDP-glucose 4-epimerase
MRIGITGSNGFIGTSLLSHFAQLPGHSIRIVRRNSMSSLPPSRNPIEVVYGDLNSSAVCQEFARGVDVIFYLAHCNSPATSDLSPSSDVLLNLVPLVTLIEGIRAIGEKPHVVYFSSGGALYANRAEKIPFKETDPCGPSSSYGIQKMAAEHYLRVAASRETLTATVLRVGNAYGSVLSTFRKQGLIGVAIGNLLQGSTVKIFGHPGNVRDYIHLDDICNLCSKLLDPPERFEIYNVGTGIGHSVEGVLSLIEDSIGSPVRSQAIESPFSPDVFPSWNVLDISKATGDLGWSPTVALRSGIQRMVSASSRSAIGTSI